MDHKPDALTGRLRDLARQTGLWSPGDRILVALSGGADSVALLHLLWSLKEREPLELLAAHVNYGLRGEESEKDETFCRDLCARLSVPLHVHHPPRDSKGNVQAWARRVRYAWFNELARAHDCRRIALGHSAGDRAETVILQWLRGASRKGVANMGARRGRLIRPLITTHRTELEAYLSRHHVSFRTDASNALPKYRRNRVRYEVLPLLSDVFGLDAVAALSNSARVFDHESDFLEQEASRHRHLLEPAPGGLRIAVQPLLVLHPALALRLLKQALATLGIPPRQERLFRLLDLAARPSGRRLMLGTRATAERGLSHLWLYSRPQAWPETTVAVPGVSTLPDGSRLCVEPRTQTDGFPTGDYEIAARIPCPPGELRVRPARAGDRMRPFGLDGSRLVFDLLSEAGVPRYLRTQSWVLADRERILWLLGHRPAEEIRVLPGSGEVYQFRWETESRL